MQSADRIAAIAKSFLEVTNSDWGTWRKFSESGDNVYSGLDRTVAPRRVPASLSAEMIPTPSSHQLNASKPNDIEVKFMNGKVLSFSTEDIHTIRDLRESISISIFESERFVLNGFRLVRGGIQLTDEDIVSAGLYHCLLHLSGGRLGGHALIASLSPMPNSVVSPGILISLFIKSNREAIRQEAAELAEQWGPLPIYEPNAEEVVHNLQFEMAKVSLIDIPIEQGLFGLIRHEAMLDDDSDKQ